MEDRDQRVLSINKKSFAAALVVLLVLMLVTYALTFLPPSDEIRANAGRRAEAAPLQKSRS